MNQLRNIAAQLEEALNTIGYQPDQDFDDPAFADQHVADSKLTSTEDVAAANKEEVYSLKEKDNSSGIEDDCDRVEKEKLDDGSNIE